MRESTVENYLVRRCQEHGAEVRKVKWIGRKNAPDRVVMGLEPITIWVELKRPGKGAEEAQAREHNRMRAVGQTVVVIDTIEGVDAFVKRHGYLAREE